MNVDLKVRPAAASPSVARVGVVDCDIHPVVNSQKDMYPYLDKQWQKLLQEYGAQRRQGMQFGSLYPKSQPEACRRDAWPEVGQAGGVLELMQKQQQGWSYLRP